MNKKLIAPIASLVLLSGLSVGVTYALFTSNASSQININSGKVKVGLTSSLTWALSHYEKGEEAYDAVAHTTEGFDAVFENGGTAKFNSDATLDALTLDLDRLSPLDQIKVKMSGTNESNINIKWRYVLQLDGELIPGLKIEFDGIDVSTLDTSKTVYGSWSDAFEPTVTSLLEKDLVVTFEDGSQLTPVRDDNIYQNKDCSIVLRIEAIQGNADVDDSFVATTKEELMSYIAGWNAGTEHRPLRLGANIDVSEAVWTPLGSWEFPYFGEIKGKNYTITGIGQGGINPIFTETGEYAAGFIGIAGATEDGKELTVSNLKLANAKINLPDTGSNIGILMGYAPVSSDFNSKGSGAGAGNKQVSALTITNVSVNGTVSGKKTCGGLIGKIYSTGQAEISNCNINVDVTTATNHIAEIVAYVNGTSALNIHNNTLSGSLHAPIDQYRMDDEVVIGTFLDTYVIDSNTSTVKFYYNNNEIDDPLNITNEFNEDGSVKSINVVWDGKDLGKNVITAAHGTNKLNITLKNSATNNNQQIMTNQASDDVVVTLDNFSTTGNISIANLVLKGNCNIANSYTTAKKTLDIESGTYKKVTADSNCVAVMNGGKVTELTINQGASLYLNGGLGDEIYLQPGSSLTTGAGLIAATEDNYTFKVTIRDNRSKGLATTVNGHEYITPAMVLYFLIA